MSLLVIVMMSALLLAACGDDKDVDPTERLIGDGSVDADDCKDACEILAQCMESNADTFKDDCKRRCGQSGFFDAEVIACIKNTECKYVFECGAPLE